MGIAVTKTTPLITAKVSDTFAATMHLILESNLAIALFKMACAMENLSQLLMTTQ